jgi:hypothetical protein
MIIRSSNTCTFCFSQIDYRSKTWTCNFCFNRNPVSKNLIWHVRVLVDKKVQNFSNLLNFNHLVNSNTSEKKLFKISLQ